MTKQELEEKKERIEYAKNNIELPLRKAIRANKAFWCSATAITPEHNLKRGDAQFDRIDSDLEHIANSIEAQDSSKYKTCSYDVSKKEYFRGNSGGRAFVMLSCKQDVGDGRWYVIVDAYELHDKLDSHRNLVSIKPGRTEGDDFYVIKKDFFNNFVLKCIADNIPEVVKQMIDVFKL